ncbi:hypothetical protein COM21_16405 [Bacillus toyonensis]|uniref:hypothetical protein n=1 Tax=Bacillus TaxID=1386 RepID=UPI0001A0734E|nr:MULTISPECIES: hypothetical protein [Bacillus]EEL19506.1 hypothetical protein bcere0017_57220 [Bacillus cereus Rock1-3]EEL31211.1 hypothetical protein bcere0019_56560 [Bacillus cereus Rock3-28]EEL37330.1 hypothetical protein bcere0020_52560 [Bacillus cereus Rock3-29]KNH38853.1 hypothetical protein ACS75_19760 [Bacillus thuringiensis]KXY12121.1 hypothetical protein AT259_06680 [Bacillus cereus]MDH8708290.1 hypothetical protein [Stenotrophomonas sp. 1198]
MDFTFEKVQHIEDENIYRVSNVTDIYETDLFDDYNRNVDNLSLLFQERINQFIVHVDKSEEKSLKEEIDSKKISYTVFDLGRRDIFFIFNSIPRTEVLYIIKLFYGVSIENTLAIISLGNSVDIKLEKINQSKFMERLMGECFVPQIKLVPSSACAFIQYDGALLTIASNNLDICAT